MPIGTGAFYEPDIIRIWPHLDGHNHRRKSHRRQALGAQQKASSARNADSLIRIAREIAGAVGRVWTTPWVQGVRQENCDLVRFAVVSAACLSRHPPLAEMGFAIRSQTEERPCRPSPCTGCADRRSDRSASSPASPAPAANRASASVGRMQIRPLAIAGAHQFYRGREVSEGVSASNLSVHQQKRRIASVLRPLRGRRQLQRLLQSSDRSRLRLYVL